MNYKSILDQIQSDLAALQNNPDQSWTSLIREPNNPLGIFYDRMCANMTNYENMGPENFVFKVEGPLSKDEEDFINRVNKLL